MKEQRAEVAQTLLELQKCFEELVVRGVKSTGADELKRLSAIGEEFGRSGATYVAQSVGELVRAAREGDPSAARALLRAQTASRVFERVLSLDAAIEAFSDGEEQKPARPPKPELPPLEDRSSLMPLLDELARVVEGLVSSGLTAASAATRQKLDASGKEAARAKLGRLAASLRYVNDELGRFLEESSHFSARRLAFFLNRTWLISRGLKEAIDEGDRAALARLLWQSTPSPVKSLTVVTVGVQKRALLDGSASFDFRFRVLKGDLPAGTRLVWSCVFTGKKGVPAESFLHLAQPQKFTPKILLEPKELTITDAAITLDEYGSGRLLLGPKSTLKQGAAFTDWDSVLSWDPARALERVRAHQTSPLDLEIELQEELVIDSWELEPGSVNPHRSEQLIFPLRFGALELDATVSTGPDGEQLTKALKGFLKKGAGRPKLYGLLHYENCRLIFQPLSAIEEDGSPKHLMISTENVDLTSLMKTLDFT